MIISYLNELKQKAGNPSNAEIAELSGVQESTISRLFSGSVDNPRFQSVVDIVIALGGSLDELVGIVKSQPESVKIENPIEAVEKVLKAEENAMRVLDDTERQHYQEHIKYLQDEMIVLKGKLELQTEAIGQQHDTISQQYATIREQAAKLDAQAESIQFRDRIIAEKDMEIKSQKESLKRQARRYTLTVIGFMVWVTYLYWDGLNPNKGIFQYGQIVPSEGMIENTLKWLMDRIASMRSIL